MMYRRQFLSGLGLAATVPSVGFARHNSVWIPIGNFPRPKFHIGQQVSAVWDADYNEQYRNRAIIIGMAFEPESSLVPGWVYLLKWIENEGSPNFVGKDDGHHCPEDQLRALS